MSTSDIQKEQQANLHKTLWDMADDLRGSMEAYEFKSYILGLIFYRYLSEKVEGMAAQFLSSDPLNYAEAWKKTDYRDGLTEEIIEALGYVIPPDFLFSTLIAKIRSDEFDIEMLTEAIKSVSASSIGQESQEDFENLFDDMDLSSSKLGKEPKTRAKVMAKVMLSISKLPFKFEDSEIDVLGDAYEYLIGKFAQTAGKKAGEFYTPQQVSKILARIVSLGKRELKTVYDPCCGSGSLLLRVGKECKVIHYYGQEMTSTTYNLARMNMLLHGIQYQYFHIANGDTLESPEFNGDVYNAVVSNPPYSAKWSADDKFLQDDRFSGFGRLAPKSTADFAFVCDMLHHLDEDGTMAVVLPHGVLFRGGAEEAIRTILIRDRNCLDAVIGLPANLFYGTSIATCIVVFKKVRNGNAGNVLFIDASKNFERGKNQNILSDEQIDKIIQTYAERKDVEKYAHVATIEEIAENEYNLNISRYVETYDEEEPIDIKAELYQIEELEKKSDSLKEEVSEYFRELGA